MTTGDSETTSDTGLSLVRNALVESGESVTWLAESVNEPLASVWACLHGLTDDMRLARRMARALSVNPDHVDSRRLRKKPQPVETGMVDDWPDLPLTAAQWAQVRGLTPFIEREDIIRRIRAFHEELETLEAERRKRSSPVERVGNTRDYVTVAIMPDGSRYGIIKVGGKYVLPDGLTTRQFSTAVQCFEELGAEFGRLRKSDATRELEQEAEAISRYYAASDEFHKKLTAAQGPSEKETKRRLATAALRKSLEANVAALREKLLADIVSGKAAGLESEGPEEQSIDDPVSADGVPRNTSSYKLIATLPDGKWYWVVGVQDRIFPLPNGKNKPLLRQALKAIAELGMPVRQMRCDQISVDRFNEMTAGLQNAVQSYLDAREKSSERARKHHQEPRWTDYVNAYNLTWSPPAWVEQLDDD